MRSKTLTIVKKVLENVMIEAHLPIQKIRIDSRLGTDLRLGLCEPYTPVDGEFQFFLFFMDLEVTFGVIFPDNAFSHLKKLAEIRIRDVVVLVDSLLAGKQQTQLQVA